MFKKILMASMLTAGVSIPLMAQAVSDLSLLNCTNKPSTVVTNNGGCSDTLPDGKGVTPPNPYYPSCSGTPAWVVPASDVNTACKTSKNNTCVADVYMTNNCSKSGSKIAQIDLDLSSGKITVVSIYDNNYHIDGGTWYVKITDNGNVAKSKA
ncbi:MAG: hypothetical protein EPO11_11200 [Gammaproteobacteria bacterium]|nr:MAG: hypothetical protein EPO11_11200 [Gammaproteobacteria bacterium]